MFGLTINCGQLSGIDTYVGSKAREYGSVMEEKLEKEMY